MNNKFTKSPLNVPKLRFKGFEGEWEEKRIGDVLNYEQPNKYIVKNENYLLNKNYLPVLTANKAFILGYTADYSNVYDKGECIIIDDFTLDMKYVNFKFKIKSSAIKILTTIDHNLFFCYLNIQNMRIATIGHNRHYISIVQNNKIFVPSILEQQKIAKFFSLLDKQIELWNTKLQLSEQLLKRFIEKLFNINNIDHNTKLAYIIEQTNFKNKKNIFSLQGSISNRNGVLLQEQYFSQNIKSKNFENHKIVLVNEYVFNPSRINVGSISRNKTKTELLFSPMYITFRTIDNNYLKYLDYFFFSHYFKHNVESLCKGTVRNTISWDDFISLSFIRINNDTNNYLEILKKIEKYLFLIKRKIFLIDNIKRKKLCLLFF